MNDEAAGRHANRHANSVTEDQDNDRRGRKAMVPALVVAFELERRPKALNASDLTEGELRRIIDWVVSHDGGRMLLEEWVERHLVERGIREP